MSFNYHREHFGVTWTSTTPTAIPRTRLRRVRHGPAPVAMFHTHGVDLEKWPASVREMLQL